MQRVLHSMPLILCFMPVFAATADDCQLEWDGALSNLETYAFT